MDNFMVRAYLAEMQKTIDASGTFANDAAALKCELCDSCVQVSEVLGLIDSAPASPFESHLRGSVRRAVAARGSAGVRP